MRTALITGVHGGIGTALCQAFRTDGYRVIGVDCKQGNANCDLFIHEDVESLTAGEQQRAAFLQKVKIALPPEGLHVLINNAAVQILNRTESVTIEDWHRTMNTNLVAPFFLAQGLIADIERAGGSVINVASIHATATKPGFVCYATSKAALIGLTRSMAIDLGPRVRVNAISPAATATPMLLAGFSDKPESFHRLASMHPLERIAEPAEVADIALFLASDRARFVTGASFNIDGGMGVRLHDPE